MMVLLAVLAVFAIIADQLLVTSLKAMALTQHREETARRFDLAMNQLRADVWSSNRIEADGPSATLGEPDGQTIVWRIESELPEAGSGAPNRYGPAIRLTRRVMADVAGPIATGPATAPPLPADIAQWEPLPAGISFAADGPTLKADLAWADDRAAGALTMVSQLQLEGRKP
jgi:hypothetical protein